MINTMVNRDDASLDRVFQALADPTRRRILFRVAKSSCTVSDIAKPFSISAPAISRHLKVLERARMIERVRSGKLHRLRIKRRTLGQAQNVLEKLADFWGRRLDNLEELLNAEIAKSN